MGDCDRMTGSCELGGGLGTAEIEWRGAFTNAEIETLHAEGFDRQPVQGFDWQVQLDSHSLDWVCARHDGRLVGFVNVVWDGSSHAFILDTVVAHTHRLRGLGSELIAIASREAQAAGCEWLHVDFEDHLRRFYFHGCGFSATNAGLLRLSGEQGPQNAAGSASGS